MDSMYEEEPWWEVIEELLASRFVRSKLNEGAKKRTIQSIKGSIRRISPSKEVLLLSPNQEQNQVNQPTCRKQTHTHAHTHALPSFRFRQPQFQNLFLQSLVSLIYRPFCLCNLPYTTLSLSLFFFFPPFVFFSPVFFLLLI